MTKKRDRIIEELIFNHKEIHVLYPIFAFFYKNPYNYETKLLSVKKALYLLEYM